MRYLLPMYSPHVHHEDKDDDIFGPQILIEADSGFCMLIADEISRVIRLERKNTLQIQYKSGDILDLVDIPTYDFNEILCWATVNKLYTDS